MLVGDVHPERGRGCRRRDPGSGRRRPADGGDGAAQHRHGGGTPGNRKGGDVIRKIALTGGIATGKSYVATRLREAGVPMVDADVLARDVVAPGIPALAAIRKRFGPDAVRRDGTMDRVRVGADRLQGQARPARPRSHHPSRRHQGDRTISSPRCRSARHLRSPTSRWSSRPAATRTSTRSSSWPARARCSCSA